MSKHWRPDDTAVPLRPSRSRREWARVQAYWQEEARAKPLPAGATAGLVLVAAACLGVAFGIYQAFGPRQVIADGAQSEPGVAAGPGASGRER